MLRISQLKIDAMLDQEQTLQKKILNRLHLKENRLISYKIVKRSIDARDKNQVFYVYEIDIELPNEENFLKHNKDKLIHPSHTPEYHFEPLKINKDLKPVIVGFGPSGIFASYILVLNGIKPLIIERGEDVVNRTKTIEDFWQTNKLNIQSNVQFGEGGAGTFSDGKLNTSSKDPSGRNDFVLKTLVKFGANPDILISSTPHIGTDVLRSVIKNMREYLIKNGATIRFNTCLTDINYQDNAITSIEVNKNENIETKNLILAIGHSARDTFKMLDAKKLKMEPKPFAVGFRIQHSQEEINISQYGHKYKNKLGKANYKLAYQSTNGHGVYSFCMCPGGYVVNASSENNRLAINGMSYYERGSKNANSAIIVTVNEKIYGNSLFSGLKFQEELEEKAYQLGNGAIPIQLLKDYYTNTCSTKFLSLTPEIKGKYHFANLNSLLPQELNEALKEGITNFASKITCFNHPDAILAGIETRSSSPLKIIRDETFNSNIKGIYPCGEGAGYAGGIMTSAIDGIKVAEALIINNQ